ncbi:COG1361 family protein [Halorussus amylolyticus]|uniref:hypothetical protein n=1 Tax=Halorussus amylolyticus TaxID=1126242 RepID=UPI001048F2A3|nr:hypothetical protein [Halorussus amylolyticus]
MDSRTVLVVAVALMVGLHGFAGSAAANIDGTVQLADAAEGSSGTTTQTVTHTFTASSNESVTANDRIQADGGNVVFEFSEWEGNGQSGEGTSWNLVAGSEYEVTYEVTVSENAAPQRYVENIFQSGPYEEIDVEVVAPQIDGIFQQNVDLAFESQNEGTAEHEVDIDNVGSGEMRPTDITFSGVPSGLSVDYSGLPNRIDAGGSTTATLELTADSSLNEGTYQFDATVTDNLGNTETFPVEVQVTKPAVLGVDDDEVDVGDVLVGTDETTEFTITEEGGSTGISGVDSQVTSSDQHGSIDFSGLPYVSTSAGGSDTAEVTISAGDNAPQHSDLEFDARLTPDSENGVGEEVTFTGRVIYPARFGDLSMSDTEMVFDEPQSEVSSHTQTVTVDVPNDGDQELNVFGASAGIDDADVSASVVDSPDTIQGQESGEVEVEIEADPGTPEGSYPLTVEVDSDEDGTESVTSDVEVTHDVELAVERTSIEYGDVIVTENLTESTDIAEALEYRDVSNLEITKESGPDEWLTVVDRPPETLTAGETAPLVVAVEFDTSAELYREYTWEFEVTGDDIESETVTVTATPEPVSFEEIRDPLAEYTDGNDWRSDTASGMVTTLDTLEGELREGGDVSRTDLTTSIAAGRSTLLFVESVESARDTMESDGNEAAQDEVVRAAATYNLLDSYIDEYDDDELQSSAGESRDAAEETVNNLVDEQTTYYESQLESDDVSMIEQANINRQLAQLASLQGDEERAEELRAESSAAFDEYSETVAQGNEQRQEARDVREEMRDGTVTVVAGQPLVFSPANWDAFTTQSSSVLSAYDDAAASFEAAGADEEADRVTSERQQAASQLQLARYSLYGSTAVSGLLFVGLLGYLGRNTYAYVRDAREAVSGDFLVAS